MVPSMGRLMPHRLLDAIFAGSPSASGVVGNFTPITSLAAGGFDSDSPGAASKRSKRSKRFFKKHSPPPDFDADPRREQDPVLCTFMPARSRSSRSCGLLPAQTA